MGDANLLALPVLAIQGLNSITKRSTDPVEWNRIAAMSASCDSHICSTIMRVKCRVCGPSGRPIMQCRCIGRLQELPPLEHRCEVMKVQRRERVALPIGSLPCTMAGSRGLMLSHFAGGSAQIFLVPFSPMIWSQTVLAPPLVSPLLPPAVQDKG